MEQLTNHMAGLGTEPTISATLFSIPYELHFEIIKNLVDLSSPTDLKNLVQASPFYYRLFRANCKGDVARKMNRLLVPVSELVVEDALWNRARTAILMDHLAKAEVWANWYRGWTAGGGEVWKEEGEDLLGC